MEKYYYIFGLKSSATAEQIRKSYRTIARICHPDVHAQNSELQQVAAELFRRLTEAYDHLLVMDQGQEDVANGRGAASGRRYHGSETTSSGSRDEIHGSELKGPTLARNPRGHYKAGGRRIRFVLGLTEANPAPGKRLPDWDKIEAYADELDGESHEAGEPYYFVLLVPKTLLVLKFMGSSADGYGFLVVYRAFDGKFWFTTNDPGSRWQALAEGELSSQFWVLGQAKVYIEINRPNVNQDKLGREIDYRFMLASDGEDGHRSGEEGAADKCPACRRPDVWDGRTCQHCGFYLY